MSELSERTEAIAKDGRVGREQLRNEVRALDTKLDAIIGHLGVRLKGHEPQGWLQSLMGDAKGAPSGSLHA